MTAETVRTKAQEVEAQAQAPLLPQDRAIFLAQAQYLRELADQLDADRALLEAAA